MCGNVCVYLCMSSQEGVCVVCFLCYSAHSVSIVVIYCECERVNLGMCANVRRCACVCV